ncbi:ShlB/FhaC/HecB family hemolysin secretion/activation protein [Xenorhabdus stockiae]|uniref:ShlB/FhaC/HecB family hemolysin secretion/activation protein n=1 Tax=Xenorhabdus stockiae TaxID=351614 RepID=UPI003CF8DC14
MAIIIPSNMITGLIGWVVFSIQSVQANELYSVYQEKQNTQHLATSSAILDDQHQQQKEFLENAEQQRKDLKKSLLLPEQATDSFSTTDTHCVNIDEVTLLGAQSLPASVKDTLLQPIVHNCVTLIELKQLVRKVTNTYISHGYITSQAQLPVQDLSTGKLHIVVIEGNIEAIEIDGKSSRMAKMLFPGMVGNPLNLRDIEQGLEQLNRLSTSLFTIDIQPGIKPGYSIVYIRQKAGYFPGKVRLGIENGGQKKTGEYQANVGLVLDAPLSLGEQWSFSWTQDTDVRPAYHSRNLAFSINVPYGYWTTRYQYFRNTSSQILTAKFPYKSENQTHQFDISRTLYRDGKQKVSLQAGGRHKTLENAIGEQKLSVSSPVIKTSYISPQYSTVLNRGYFTSNLILEYGTAVTSSPVATRNRSRNFKLSSSYYYPITTNIAYLTSIHGQLSMDNLFSSEQMSLGGFYSVRGYKKSLNGNQGLYWRQEVTHQLDIGQLGMLMLTGSVDYGHMVGQRRYGVDKAHLLGTAFGGTLIKQALSSRLMVGKPLYYPHTFKPDMWVFYAAVSLEF